MKCEHCGKLISISSNYCEYCGKEVQSFGKRTATTTKKLFAQSVELCKKRKWLFPVIMGIVVALIAVLIFVNRERNLDFTDYVSFEVSGYDGAGRLVATMDYNKLAEDILGKEPNRDSVKEYEKYLDYMAEKRELMQAFSVEVDRDANLKNGDIFLVTVSISTEDSDILKENKIKFKSETYKKAFTIGVNTDELFEPIELNLLDYVTVEFYGKNGSGKANISYTTFYIDVATSNGKMQTLSFHYNEPLWGEPNFEVHSSQGNGYAMIKAYLEDGYNLSNGDTVKVTLRPTDSTLAEQFGIKITETEKEYTVSGLE